MGPIDPRLSCPRVFNAPFPCVCVCVCGAESDRNLTPPSTCSSTFIIKTNLGQNKCADCSWRGEFNVIWDCCVKKKGRNRVFFLFVFFCFFFCTSLTFRGEKTCDHSEQKKLLLNVGSIHQKKKTPKNPKKPRIEPPRPPPLQRPHFVVAFCALVRG